MQIKKKESKFSEMQRRPTIAPVLLFTFLSHSTPKGSEAKVIRLGEERKQETDMSVYMGTKW
jgi:hypothetical protein